MQLCLTGLRSNRQPRGRRFDSLVSPFFLLAPSELTGGADGAAPEASVEGEAPSSLFCPFPLVQQKQRQTSEAWVLYFYSLLSPRKDARPLISFLPLPPRATKAKADERSLGAVLLLSSLPPQGCKAPHLFFTPSPSGNKSKGRRAKPGCCTFFSFSPRKEFKGSSSLFYPFPLGQQKQRQTSEAWGAEVFLSPFPRRDAGPLISFFFFSCTGNKSSGRAKPGCCSSSSSSSSPPARMQGPSSLFHPFPLGQQKQRQTSEAWVL